MIIKKTKEVEYVEIEKEKLITICKSGNGYVISYLMICILCFLFGYIRNDENFYLLAAIYAIVSPVIIFIVNKITINKFIDEL